MKLFILLSCIPVFMAGIYALAVYKRLSVVFRSLVPFLVVSGIVQLVSMLLWLFNINNMPLLHLYVPLGCCCLIWFYATVFRSVVHPAVLYTFAALFVVFSAINSAFYQSVFSYNSTALMTQAVLVIILALSSFLLTQHAVVRSHDRTDMQGLNWVNSGLLLFYASSSLLYYYGELITQLLPPELGRYVWTLHGVFSVIMYCSFIAGIWKSLKKSTS